MASARRLTESLGLVALLAFAIACQPTVTTPARTAAAPEELRIAVATLGNEALDPMKGPNNNGAYLRLMFDQLVGADYKGETISKETGIAKDWTVSSDGKTYNFTIRDGVKFHNGDDLTADDVKFSLDRLKGTDVLTSFGPEIAGQIDAVSVVGKNQVQLRLKAQNQSFLLLLSPLIDVSGTIMPKRYFESVGADEFAKHPIGSGPYKLVDRQVGSFMNFELAAPAHFAIGTPRFKRVTVRPVSDEGARLALLRTGQVDLIDVGTESAAALQKEGLRLVQQENQDELLMMYQLQRPDEATLDVNVRKALSYAIDRKTINDRLLNGLGVLRNNLWPAQLGGEVNPVDPYDVAQAKTFLNATPYGQGGKKLTIQLQVPIRSGWPQLLQIGEAVQSYWNKIGVDTAITYRDFESMRAEWRAGKLPAPAVIMFNQIGRVDNSTASKQWGCNGQQKVVCDPALDQLFAQWASAPSEAEYLRLAKQTQSYILDHRYGSGVLALGGFYAASKQIRDDFSLGFIPAEFNVRGLVWNP